MIFVVVEEVVPGSQRAGNTDLATVGAILGVVVMMVLDVVLGCKRLSKRTKENHHQESP